MDNISTELESLQLNDTFFWSARLDRKTGISRFINQRLGLNEIRHVGKFIAQNLNLENPEAYTGYCFVKKGSEENVFVYEDLENYEYQDEYCKYFTRVSVELGIQYFLS